MMRNAIHKEVSLLEDVYVTFSILLYMSRPTAHHLSFRWCVYKLSLTHKIGYDIANMIIQCMVNKLIQLFMFSEIMIYLVAEEYLNANPYRHHDTYCLDSYNGI